MQRRRKTFRQGLEKISKGREGVMHMAHTLNTKGAAWLLHKIEE